jgi:hypothetical protein
MLFHVDVQSHFWILVSILAAWRATRLLCYEEGPFGLLTALRRIMYRLHMGAVVDCFHCAGLWISAAIVLLTFDPSPIGLLLALTVSGGTSALESALPAESQ